MNEILVQAVKKGAEKVVKTVTIPTSTPVPDTQTAGLSVASFLTDFFDFFANFDYQLVFKAIIMVILFMWLLVIMWVILDAHQRYKKWYIVILWIILIIPFNLLGLLAYFAIRPHYTTEEREWSELEIKYLEHELLSTTHCRQCQKMVQVDHLFCWHCGEDLQWECQGCKHHNSVGYKFCINCGLVANINAQSNKTKSILPPTTAISKEKLKINKKKVLKKEKNLLLEKKRSRLKLLFKNVKDSFRMTLVKVKGLWNNYRQRKIKQLESTLEKDLKSVKEAGDILEKSEDKMNALEAYLLESNTETDSLSRINKFRRKKKKNRQKFRDKRS